MPRTLRPMISYFLVFVMHAILPANADVTNPSSCALSGSYTGVNLVRVAPRTVAQLECLLDVCHDECTCHRYSSDAPTLNQTFSYILSTTSLYRLESCMGSSNLNVTENLETLLNDSPKQVSTYNQYPVSTSLDSDFYAQYRSIDVLHQKWRALAQRYSSCVTTSTYGTSVQGIPLLALAIGHTDSRDPRRVLLNAAQHAREWLSAAAATYVAERLAIACQRNMLHDIGIPKNVQMIIVPVSNPDGYNYTKENDPLWRKNLGGVLYGSHSPSPCRGVDLNRNWDIDFATALQASRNPCDNNFQGPFPFSEAETRALRGLVLNETPDIFGTFATAGIRAHVDLHTFGELVLAPWQYTAFPARDADLLDDIGRKLVYAMNYEGNADYEYSRGAAATLLYPGSGFMSDWVYQQGVLSMTVELRPGSATNLVNGFYPVPSNIEPGGREAFAAMKILMHYAATAPLNLSKSDTIYGKNGADRKWRHAPMHSHMVKLRLSLQGWCFVWKFVGIAFALYVMFVVGQIAWRRKCKRRDEWQHLFDTN